MSWILQAGIQRIEKSGHGKVCPCVCVCWGGGGGCHNSPVCCPLVHEDRVGPPGGGGVATDRGQPLHFLTPLAPHIYAEVLGHLCTVEDGM